MLCCLESLDRVISSMHSLNDMKEEKKIKPTTSTIKKHNLASLYRHAIIIIIIIVVFVVILDY